MKVRVDLHNHLSTLEENLEYLADETVERARERLGPGGIIAVINAQDKGEGRYETFTKGLRGEDLGSAFYDKRRDIYVLKGQEVFTGEEKPEGHLLVLGLDRGDRLEDRKSIEDSLKQARDHGGVIIADHGFHVDGLFTKHDPEEYLGHLDGIEVHNGEAWLPIPGYFRANKKAQEFYERIKRGHDVGGVCSSDGHSIREVGSSYSVIDKPDFSSPDNLRESLRRSIRSHKDFSDDKKTNSYFYGLNHMWKVVFMRLWDKIRGVREFN